MEINTIVQKYIPEKPKVIASEQIEVYVPTANYNYPGLASFDSRGFIVDGNGKVKLRRNSLRNVKDFTVDVTTGKCTIYYDDGTEATVSFPTNSETLYNRVGLITTIDVTSTSFVQYKFSDEEVEWYLILPNTSTGFTDDKYLVSFEESGSIDYSKPDETPDVKVGYYTINDSVFKGSDGSLLISISNEYYKENFSGRLLLLGGEIFTDTQIVNITYSPDKHKITIFKTDGSYEVINAVTMEYIEDSIKEKLATVYNLQGAINFSELPILSTFDRFDVGKVWYIKDSFVTDSRFSEGYGISVPAGTNVTLVLLKEGFKYDILGSLIDTSLYYTKTEIIDLVVTKSMTGKPNGVTPLNGDGVVDNKYLDYRLQPDRVVGVGDVGSLGTSVQLSSLEGPKLIMTDYHSDSGEYLEVNYSGVHYNSYWGENVNGRWEEYTESYQLNWPRKNGTFALIEDLDNNYVKFTDLDMAVKDSVATNPNPLTDEEKASACDWLGVTERLGDIETALDSVIAIQNSLIGGGV